MFLRWRRIGAQGIEGHLETDYLAHGPTEEAAREAVGAMTLSEVKANDFIGCTALLTGWAWRGLGSLCAIIPEDRLLAFFPPGEGLLHYFGVLPFFALSLCSIVSLAFMFSCCNMKPAAATVVTMTATTTTEEL